MFFFPSDQCGEGETYMDCGTACENVCGKPDPQFCTEQCTPQGCYCTQKGYKRNAQGKCVPIDHCDPQPLC